jgi:hypothetical protein
VLNSIITITIASLFHFTAEVSHGHPRRIAGHDPRDDKDDQGEPEKDENGMDYTTGNKSDGF